MKNNNTIKQIINQKYESKNNEEIVNYLNNNEKKNYVFANYQSIKKSKTRIKFDLSSQNSIKSINKINNSIENQKQSKTILKKKAKYHSTNNSLLSDNNVFLEMEKRRINKE